MRTLNARCAIYIDIPIEVPDDFDCFNCDVDGLIDKAWSAMPEPYDPKAGRVVAADAYEVLSIWDDDNNHCVFAGE